MTVLSKVKSGLAIGAVAAVCAAIPQAAEAAVALEGCLVSKQNTLCTAASGDLQWTDHRSAAYASAEGYFQYHGVGPWTIQYSDGTITCPPRTVCERFFPAVLVPVDSQLLLSQTGNGTVFAGALESGAGD